MHVEAGTLAASEIRSDGHPVVAGDRAEVTSALRLRRREGVQCRSLADRALLLDPRTGACFELNRVGAEVWSRLDGTNTLEEVCAQLQASVGVAPELLRSDVLRFGRDLEGRGLAERLP
jgi:hypothetical protein